VLEILVLAMPHPLVFQGSISKANSGWLDTLASPTGQLSKRNHGGWRNLYLCFRCAALSGD
jgi:hypothetical protein